MACQTFPFFSSPVRTAGPNSAIIAYCSDMAPQGEVTRLLTQMSSGDKSAEEDLLPRVYLELHRLASAQLRSERPGHTLQATALVHEAYLRLCRPHSVGWHDRLHFFRVAARLMRRVLIDYARQRNAARRGSGNVRVPLEDGLIVSDDQLFLVLEIDQVLQDLSQKSPRMAQIVEMKFFGGLSDAEIAASLDLCEKTVQRDWLKARAWLHQQLSKS